MFFAPRPRFDMKNILKKFDERIACHRTVISPDVDEVGAQLHYVARHHAEDISARNAGLLVPTRAYPFRAFRRDDDHQGHIPGELLMVFAASPSPVSAPRRPEQSAQPAPDHDSLAQHHKI
jgi:hypothetical protein